MQQLLTQKLIGTAILIAAIGAIMLTTYTAAFAKSENGGGTKSNCNEAHAKALQNGNGNHYGLIKNQNCPPK